MVNDLQELIADSAAGAIATQALQARYDTVGWQIKDPSYAQVRHMLLHLMKITADVAALVEHVEHSVQNGIDAAEIDSDFAKVLEERADIGGDLLFHAAQFANLGGYNLTEELVKIYSRNSKRFAPDSEFAELEGVKSV